MKLVGSRLFFLAILMLCFEAVGEDEELEAKKRTYASIAADCDEAIAKRKASLSEDYRSDVWRLKERYQKDGDLESALAAKEEWGRLSTTRSLTRGDLVASPKELRVLQDGYLDRQGRVEREVAEEFVDTLKREARELARDGRLTDGKELQQQIDKIKQRYLNSNPAPATEPNGKSEINDADTSLEDPLKACEEAIRQRRILMQEQYEVDLEAMEGTFQSQGALEELLATKTERDRFKKTSSLTDKDVVDSPAALQELQLKYVEIHSTISTSVAEDFIDLLNQRKASLTTDGKLVEAMKAKTDAEKIKQRYSDAPKRTALPWLGNKCDYFEGLPAQGGWRGTWKRRGNTNVFDCSIYKFHFGMRETCTYVATLTLQGPTVVVDRTEILDSAHGRKPPDRVIWKVCEDGKSLCVENGDIRLRKAK